MGIIQSAVNQALGTVGTVAGIGRVAKTSQESVDLQKKAAADATAEREKKKAYVAQLEEEVKKDPSLQPTTVMNQVGDNEFEAETTVEPSERAVYMRNQLANAYEESGQFGEAYNLRESAKKDQFVLDLLAQQRKNALAEAAIKKDLKAEQLKKSDEFQKNFLEGVNTMKGVRSVTTFGADTGLPNVNMRTIYTPRGEEVK